MKTDHSTLVFVSDSQREIQPCYFLIVLITLKVVGKKSFPKLFGRTYQMDHRQSHTYMLSDSFAFFLSILYYLIAQVWIVNCTLSMTKQVLGSLYKQFMQLVRFIHSESILVFTFGTKGSTAGYFRIF